MTAPEIDDAGQARLVAALAHTLAADGPVEPIETHISRLLVTPAVAWKFKRPVAPGFVDFRRRDARRHACEDELRLNRRFAPALYVDVVAVTGSVEAPRVGGDGEPLDWLLRMRAFDPRGLWDRLAARGELGAAQVGGLVAVLARLQADAAVAAGDGGFGTPGQARAPMLENLDALDDLLHAAPEAATLARLREWERARFAALEPVFAERLAAGRVREGHGDLHLGNVVEIGGRTTLFDCIEFADAWRWIDVASDAAFMAMDLDAHGLPALANRFVDGWMTASGDHDAARVLRYYRVHRALVRAKVAALRQRQPGAPANLSATVRRYLALADATTRTRPPVLLVTHGVSGSGKTTATQALVDRCGAIRVRADVERKRLFGLAPLARPDADARRRLYAREAGDRTYARLLQAAGAILDGGDVAVLDAAFLHRGARDAARRWAAARGAAFAILDCEADVATLRQRVAARAARGDDASDADAAVLEAQLASREPLAADERALAWPLDGADWTARLHALTGGA